MKSIYLMIKVVILSLLLLLFFACDSGSSSKESVSTSSSAQEGLPPSVSSTAYSSSVSVVKTTCINNYYKKDLISTGFALCVDDIDAQTCQDIAEEDETYGVDVFMIEESCLDSGFSVDSLDQSSGMDMYLQLYLFDQSNTNVDKPTNTEEFFPDVDEEAMLTAKNATTIRTVANGATFNATAVESSKRVQLVSSDVISGSFEKGIVVSNSFDVSSKDSSKALFVGDDFQGIIQSVVEESSYKRIYLKEADSVEEVYSSFDLEFQNDALLGAVQRAIVASPSIGTYDAMNATPLQVSAYKKAVLTRGVMKDEIILRIDIPQGYTIPIHPRSLECSFWDASCDFTVAGQSSSKLGMDLVYPEGALTFDSSGSYIEIGIGSYLKVHYDHNIIGSDIFKVTGAQSAYYKINANVKISGNYLGFSGIKDYTSWEKNLKLIEGLHVEIVHPYSAFVKTAVYVNPTLTFGAGIALNGFASYQTLIERTGEVRYSYDSQTGEASFSDTIKESADALGESNVKVGLEASGSIYIFPNLTYVPAVVLLRLSKPISLISFRSGAKLDTTLSGKIEEGFVMLNDGKTSSESLLQSGVSSTLYGLFQAKWMIVVPPWKVYVQESYADIGSKLGIQKIFDWSAPLLKKPIINIKENSSNPLTHLITFSSSEKDTVAGNLYYYYTLSEKDSALSDIAVKNIEKHSPVWRSGNKAIEVNNGQFIKVRAVLYNRDMSDSVWAFGTSMSEQVTKQVVDVLEPVITPLSTGFVDSLQINITQTQGYDIYYALNGASSIKYSGAFNIANSTNLTAFTKAEVNGEQVLSKQVSANYTKCTENETLIDSICVVTSSSSSSVSSVQNSSSSSSLSSENSTILKAPIATPDSGEFSNSITVSLSSPDDVEIRYLINNEEYDHIYNAPFTFYDDTNITTFALKENYNFATGKMESKKSETIIYKYTKKFDVLSVLSHCDTMYEQQLDSQNNILVQNREFNSLEMNNITSPNYIYSFTISSDAQTLDIIKESRDPKYPQSFHAILSLEKYNNQSAPGEGVCQGLRYTNDNGQVVLFYNINSWLSEWCTKL